MVDLFMHREFDDKKKASAEDEAEEEAGVVEEPVDDVTNTINKFKDGAEGDNEEEDEGDYEENENF